MLNKHIISIENKEQNTQETKDETTKKQTQK